ncbi:MAG: hypothetical protein IJU47_00855 [Verrucomicrobia bacterium]|nr:hypothetical protein [Verrucomicrobiota bacterium]
MKNLIWSWILAFSLAYVVGANAQSKEEVAQVEKFMSEIKFEKITAERILSDFKKGGFENIHPRMLASEKDIERLKELAQSKDPLVEYSWESIKGGAEWVMRQPIPAGILDTADVRRIGTHVTSGYMRTLLMTYWVTGEEKYAQYAFKLYENLCTYEDWGIAIKPPYKDRHYLDTAMGLFCAALVYDGLYDFLSDEQKDFIFKTVDKYVFTPTLAQFDGTVPLQWWCHENHNWNGICNGNIALGALTFLERDPQRLSKLAAYALECLPYYITSFEPDGQSVEGLAYWEYGLISTLYSLEGVQRMLGTTYGLAETPGLKKSGYFPILMTGPVVTLNVGDDPIKNNKYYTFFWFGKHFNDPLLAKLQYDLLMQDRGRMEWFDLLCYDGEMVREGREKEVKIPLDNHIYGIEISSLLERNSDPNALFIAIHAGDNKVNHAHLDAGTFEIQALGEVWAYGCLGGDDYGYPGYFKRTRPDYFDKPEPPKEPGRWHFYRMRAEGKNALVFNPDMRPDQDPQGTAYVQRKISTADHSAFIVELENCYSRDVVHYTRGIAMDRTARVISVQDDFETKAPSVVWWNMHTKADIKISDSGREAILSLKEKKLYLSLTGVETAKFEVLPAAYLPGQSFPLTKNSPNTDFKKLAVKMTEQRKGSLRVDFGVSEFKEKKPLIPLSDWK